MKNAVVDSANQQPSPWRCWKISEWVGCLFPTCVLGWPEHLNWVGRCKISTPTKRWLILICLQEGDGIGCRAVTDSPALRDSCQQTWIHCLGCQRIYCHARWYSLSVLSEFLCVMPLRKSVGHFKLERMRWRSTYGALLSPTLLFFSYPCNIVYVVVRLCAWLASVSAVFCCEFLARGRKVPKPGNHRTSLFFIWE